MTTHSPRPALCAIVGDHGAGKRRLAKALAELLGSEHCGLIALDDYATPRSADEGPGSGPRDPAAVNLALMAQHLRLLRQGETVFKPVLDPHSGQLGAPEFLRPAPLLLAYGVHGLSTPELRASWDVSLFVETGREDELAQRLVLPQRSRADLTLVASPTTAERPRRTELRIARPVAMPALDALRDIPPGAGVHVASAAAGADVIVVDDDLDDVTAARIEARLLAALPAATPRRGKRPGADAIVQLLLALYLVARGVNRVSPEAARSVHPAPGA